MNSGKKPNVLFLVWDACRLDYAKQYASTLTTLAENGAWFENAIAPATWSLPSHTSMFTGEYPHEHGITQPSQSTMPATLAAELKKQGYGCYCVSGNGFASHRWGFDEPFDHLRFTQGPEPYADGKEVYGSLRGKLEHEGKNELSALQEVARECVRHDKPLKSMANLGSVLINHVSRERFPSLQRIPHPLFRAGPRYTYSGKKNTKAIEQVLSAASDGDEPFFIFSNYMETHRPYVPDKELQQKHLGETLQWDELVRLNEEVADSWNFLRLLENGTLDEQDVHKLRSLYAGEVETVDRHLGELLDLLECHGVLDETVVIVTADHGEMLGETDAFGRQRMGHQAAMSKHLSNVPLVVSHPAVEADTVETQASLKNLFEMILSVGRDGTVDIDTLLTDSGALCEYPALGDERMYEEHPDVSEAVVAERVSQDSVSVHRNDWHVVANSDGDLVADREGQRVPTADVPDELIAAVESSLKALSELTKADVDEATAARLQDLGYL